MICMMVFPDVMMWLVALDSEQPHGFLPFGPHPGAPPNPRSTASNEAPGDMDFPDQPWLIVVNNG
jgi:hypothetical protein